MKRFVKCVNRLIFYITFFTIVVMIFNFLVTDSNVRCKESSINFIKNYKINGVETYLDNDIVQFSYNTPTFYTLEVTEDMAGKCLEFYTSHIRFYLYLDDELYYTIENGSFFNHTAGTICNMVNLPSDSVGKTITIEFYNCYDWYKNCEQITFMYGNQFDILKYLFKEEFFKITISTLLLISGIFALTGGLIFKKYLKNITDVIYLGSLEFFIAVWAMSESNIVRVLVNNPSALNTVCYYSLFIAPLFCCLYVKNNTYGKNVSKKFITFLLFTHCSYIISVTLLQIFNICDFVRVIRVYHIILIIEVITLCTYILKQNKNYKSRNRSRYFDFFFMILLVGVIVDIISWNLTYSTDMILTSVGLFIYINSIIIRFIKNAINELRINMNAEELKQIAYTDQLTEINNRNAFVSRINSVDISNIVIISFDLNNLKYYNDNFGHDKGDLLLKSMALTLKDVFGDDVYRIGGDEFEAVLIDTSIDDVWKMLNTFEEKEVEFNKSDKGIVLQSAYGVGFYEEGGTINDILKMADENMYTHKKFLKNKGVNILHQ